MDDHAGVLQQRVQIVSVGGHREEPLEGVGCSQRKEQETHRHPAHDAENARQEGHRQTRAKPRYSPHPNGQHQRPEQERTFVPTPNA